MTSAIALSPGSTGGTSSTVSYRAFIAVRLIAAGLLAFAAGTKSYSLTIGIAPHQASALIPILVEAYLAIWLAVGIKPVWAWRATVIVFSLLLGVSTLNFIRGIRSCGCFGLVPTRPEFMGFLDLGVLLALLTVRRPALAGTSSTPNRLLSVTAIFVVTAVGAIGAATAWRFGEKAFLTIDDPTQWVGKPFPLHDTITIGADLNSGSWLLIFYRPDCPACREAIKSIATDSRFLGPGTKIAAVGVAPASGSISTPVTWVRGTLKSNWQWTGTTPTFVGLDHGIVTRVSSSIIDQGLPSSAAGAANSTNGDISSVNVKEISRTQWLGDLGEVIPGKTYRIRFSIHSPLDHDLHVRGVNAGCGCTNLPKPPQSIPAVGSVNVDVFFHPAGAPGLLAEESVWLTTDAPTLPPLELRIRAILGTDNIAHH